MSVTTWESFFVDFRNDQVAQAPRCFIESLKVNAQLDNLEKTIDFMAHRAGEHEQLLKSRQESKQKRAFAEKL